jgi:hypothetical protein
MTEGTEAEISISQISACHERALVANPGAMKQILDEAYRRTTDLNGQSYKANRAGSGNLDRTISGFSA